jgi:hypothetical protein
LLFKRNLYRYCLRTRNIKTLILDEADEMLNKGFKEQIYDVYRYLPPETQVVLVSATLPNEVGLVAYYGAVRLVQLVSATGSYRASLPLTLRWQTGPKRRQDMSFINWCGVFLTNIAQSIDVMLLF